MGKTSANRRRFLKQGTLMGGGLLAIGTTPPTQAAQESTAKAGQDVIWECFKQRRSVRQFKPDPVPEAHIEQMIQMACLAPTSGNQQPWKFLVVRDSAKIEAMKEACVQRYVKRQLKQDSTAEDRQAIREKALRMAGGYFSAPVYIVVLTDNNSRYASYNHWDGPLAAGYLMLAARALGYGTVHITDTISEAISKKVLNIPDHYTRVCITPVGVPAEWPTGPKKKKLEECLSYETL